MPHEPFVFAGCPALKAIPYRLGFLDKKCDLFRVCCAGAEVFLMYIVLWFSARMVSTSPAQAYPQLLEHCTHVLKPSGYIHAKSCKTSLARHTHSCTNYREKSRVRDTFRGYDTTKSVYYNAVSTARQTPGTNERVRLHPPTTTLKT